MNSKGGKKRRNSGGLSRDDALLWRAVAGSVRKLPGRDVEIPPEDDGKTSKETPPEPAGPGRRVSRVVSPPSAAPPRQAPLVVGGFAGVDRRTAERLKRGKLPVEARLDLHGMYRDDAHRAFADFVMAHADAGRRCVLVITGKGTRSENGRGVLRDQLPQWANLPPLRDKILALAHAAPGDGGTGAYYLLLKRKR